MKNHVLMAVLILLVAFSGSICAQIVNQQISYPSTQLQNEEQVFYCPTDSNIVIANWRDFRLGYRQCGIGRSIDGGVSWTDNLNLLQMGFDSRQSDPTMTVDAAGNFYMSFLDYSAMVDDDSSFVIFIKSTDKGANWTGPYPVSTSHGDWFEDKQFIAADRTGGAHNGNVYVGWARFPNPTRIMFARSLDGGITFEDTMIVGPSQYHPPCGETPVDAGQFTQPIVGADGSVYVFWSGSDLIEGECSGYYAMKMSKSTDGGASFSTIAEPIFYFNPFNFADGGINVYNSAAGDADITGGPYDGNIYISTVNGNAEDIYYHGDVIMIKSTDGGATWLPPIRINDDPLGLDVDQFHPWLVVNEDGVIATVFYDQRMDINHYLFDVFGAYSFDGGETFTTNHRITDVSSSPSDLKTAASDIAPRDPLEGQFDDDGVYHVLSPMAGKIAEYIGVTSYHDNITAVWTDSRNGNQDVFSASFRIPFLKPRLYGVDDGGLFKLVGDSLFWSTCWHEGDVTYHVQIDDNSDFSSPEMETVVSDNKLYSASVSVGDGTHFWRVKAYRTIEGDSTDYSDSWTFNVDTQAPTMVMPLSPAGNMTITDSLPTLVWSYAAPGVSSELYEIEVSADSLFSMTPPYYHYSGIVDTFFTMTDVLIEDLEYFWRVNHYDIAENASGYSPYENFTFIKYLCGDANGDLTVNVGDAVFLISYAFRGGPAPVPLESGDANCDGSTNVGDAVFIISYVFRGGPEPCCP